MTVLHRASWVVPVTSSPIKDGGVIVDNGCIVKVGPYKSLTAEYTQTIDHGEGILMPGLVNSHCHLELSHFNVSGQYSPAGDMVQWIKELLACRESESRNDIPLKLISTITAMHNDGIDLICDIGNDPSLHRQLENGPQILYFRELLGLSTDALNFMRGSMVDDSCNYTCHAPYSTHKDLLLHVKQHCRDNNRLFPIHTAESSAETDFIQTGQGAFRHFIEERGSFDGSYTTPECSPVAYLDQLNLLDKQTLCVHCVQIDQDDIDILKKSEAQVCLCPGSNDYLGVGHAPVEQLLDAGIKPCLGTDSLASNPTLSLWREMNLIHLHHPGVSAESIVHMATLNGALALGSSEYGSLEEGKVSMIFTPYTGNAPLEFIAFDHAEKRVSRCM